MANFISEDISGTWDTKAATPPTVSSRMKWFDDNVMFCSGTAMGASGGDPGVISLDDGETWAAIAAPGMDDTDCIDLTQARDGTYWGLFRNNDTSEYEIWWSEDLMAWTLTETSGADDWHTIAHNPRNAQELVIGGVDDPAGTPRFAVWVTTDGGAAWTQHLLPAVTVLSGGLIVKWSGSGRLLALLNTDVNVIYTSDDGGTVWTLRYTETNGDAGWQHLQLLQVGEGGLFFSLRYATKNAPLGLKDLSEAAASQWAAILRSTDDGGNWEHILDPITLFAADEGAIPEIWGIAYSFISNQLYIAPGLDIINALFDVPVFGLNHASSKPGLLINNAVLDKALEFEDGLGEGILETDIKPYWVRIGVMSTTAGAAGLMNPTCLANRHQPTVYE